jgi:hypothetical protein
MDTDMDGEVPGTPPIFDYYPLYANSSSSLPNNTEQQGKGLDYSAMSKTLGIIHRNSQNVPNNTEVSNTTALSESNIVSNITPQTEMGNSNKAPNNTSNNGDSKNKMSLDYIASDENPNQNPNPT